MSIYLDTGLCVPESHSTLCIQQEQLKAGIRDVQMFPLGTTELPLPQGLRRFENSRGVFHFQADKISAETIAELSSAGRENEFLNLGPYSKPVIAQRVRAGERLLSVTEYSSHGVEVRSAAGTDSTINEQREYFDITKQPGNSVVVGCFDVILERLNSIRGQE